MKPQISLDCEPHHHPESVSIPDGDCGVISCSQKNIMPQQPAKRPTRQWAAWTRREEESFFTALRQVGKNFEKITCRVQSKNKDQVRHYYYRLVKRMNKLLGPELCLDAKNSKDTVAAMLRWWSLLEKYSCKASKLHLKPRRFKIFIEALESQLLKDRQKSLRKRLSLGENCSPTASNAISSQNRTSSHDGRGAKQVLVDSQNIQKLELGKGSYKRNFNIAINRGDDKGEPTAMKPTKRRQKSGVVSSAASRRWEKGAADGVSLVADAAEHLERTEASKEAELDQQEFGQKKADLVVKVPSHVPNCSQNLLVESSAQTTTKLKLQLFPIDDSTRRALEMDKHNPHLELTLSARKKISSVVEHLSRKWGNSITACGELMLFPFGVQRENLAGYRRWTQNSIITAADVYALIGKPPVFRLRYGWFSNDELGPRELQALVATSCMQLVHNKDMDKGKGSIVSSVSITMPSVNERSGNFIDHSKDQINSVNQSHSPAPSSINLPSEIHGSVNTASNNDFFVPSTPPASLSRNQKETGDEIEIRQLENGNDLRLSNSTTPLAGEWTDSHTNFSVGELLAEVPQDPVDGCLNLPVVENSQCFRQIPFNCDSFDAAIAAHKSRQLEKVGLQPCISTHSASILDAEETCDAFSFQKKSVLCQWEPGAAGTAPSEACQPITGKNGLNEKKTEARGSKDIPANADPMDICQSDAEIVENRSADCNSLTDMYWPDSLGPLDLDMPSSKNVGQYLILSDSLGGFNRLIANSLDAFQNCLLFGLDKKEPAATTESQRSASFSDLKISAEV